MDGPRNADKRMPSCIPRIFFGQGGIGQSGAVRANGSDQPLPADVRAIMSSEIRTMSD